MDIRAALAAEPHARLTIETVQMRQPRAHEVVVRIDASGVCHSDLNPLEGRAELPLWPLVLGHEATGIVEAIGSGVHQLRPGDRVIASALRSCGRCYWCVRGETNLCAQGSIPIDPPLSREDGSPVATWMSLGTFADAMLIAEGAAIRIESDLPPEQLALIGCGVTTGIGAVINTAQVRPGESVAVVGLGGVGQSVIQGARLSGAGQIIAIDPVAMKRSVATQFGATNTVDPTEIDLVEAVQELTGGRGVDHAFEVVGRADTVKQAYDATRRGGALTLVGASSPEVTAPWSLYDQMRHQRRVYGSLLGATDVRRDFPLIVSMVEAGLVDLATMVTRRITLDEINEGFDAMASGEVIRAVVVN